MDLQEFQTLKQAYNALKEANEFAITQVSHGNMGGNQSQLNVTGSPLFTQQLVKYITDNQVVILAEIKKQALKDLKAAKSMMIETTEAEIAKEKAEILG